MFAPAKALLNAYHPEPYWILEWDDADGNVVLYAVTFDGFDIYAAGIEFDSGGSPGENWVLYKINRQGEVVAAKKIDWTATAQFRAYGIAVDSSGNIYICGSGTTSTSQRQPVLLKYNSSFTLQWSATADNGGDGYHFYDVKLDSSEEPVCLWHMTTGSYIKHGASHFNSSGTHQWSAAHWDSTTSNHSYIAGAGRIGLDGSDNVFVCISDWDGTSERGLSTKKLNSSGTIQWHKLLVKSSSNIQGVGDGVVDSSGNVYNCGSHSNILYIVKYNTSGTLQWQKQITFTSLSVTAFSIDGNDNLYVACLDLVSGSYKTHIIQINTSGTVTDAFSIETGESSSNILLIYGMDFDANAMILSGQAYDQDVGRYVQVLIKCPIDMSFEGVVSGGDIDDYDFSAETWSTSNSSLSDNTGGTSDKEDTPSNTGSATTPTTADATLTETKIDLAA